MTTTSYEVSKRLKEFLGDTAPEPTLQIWWEAHPPQIDRLIGPDAPAKPRFIDNGSWRELMRKYNMPAAYTLEDLLSKPFCEEVAEKYKQRGSATAKQYGRLFCNHFAITYYDGGLPAVEAELLRLMEEK